MRDVVRSLVDEIAPHDATEADHRLDVLGWLESGDQIFRIAKPATPAKHLVAYSVLVDSAVSAVLLVDHRDAQRWLPTGGHVEIDEHPADTAARELLEELNVAAPFHEAIGPKPLMVTVTRTQGRSEPHTDVSLWFVFDGTVTSSLAPDEVEFADSRWWGFDEIRENGLVEFDPHLPRFIEKLSTRLVA